MLAQQWGGTRTRNLSRLRTNSVILTGPGGLVEAGGVEGEEGAEAVEEA